MFGPDDDGLVDEASTSQCVEVRTEMEEINVERKTTKEKKFKCNKRNCGYSTNFQVMLRKHSLVHAYKCSKCPKAFKSRDILRNHLRMHLVEAPFQCDECDEAFKSVTQLDMHKLMHKNIEQLHVKPPTISKSIRCKLCDYTCSSKFNLTNHLLSKHTIMEPFRCDYPDCQYKTRLEHYLKLHKKNTHVLEKRFKCDQCERSFLSEFNRNKHSFVHSKIKPLKCDKCQYYCISRANLQLHIQLKHVNEKEHKCKECGDSFHELKDLEKHKLSHIDAVEKFECHLCSFRTTRKKNLNDHVRIHEDQGRYKC